MTTKEFEQVLKLATDKVFHLQAPTGEREYVVWHGYGHNSLIGDDGVRIELLKVQLDVIWQKEPSDFLNKIKRSLIIRLGEVTLTRYLDGDMPTKLYSDELYKLLTEYIIYIGKEITPLAYNCG